MSQRAILDKFIAYINITNHTQTENNKNKLTEKLLSGHCFGFSVCYGAMQAMGKLDWWENALIALSQWNDEKSSLDEKLDLQFIDSDKTHVSQSTTLRKLFERAVNYVVFNQASHINDFTLHDIKQITILTVPSNDLSTVQKLNYFEITDQHGSVQNIKQYANASGYLSAEDITELLSKAVKPGVICIVHNYNHTISISMDRDGQLMIYDPNYLHTKKTIKKKLETPTLVNEITNILGQHHGLCIEVATFKHEDKTLFNEFDIYMNDLVANRTLEILKYDGFYMLARHGHEFIPKLLELAAASTLDGESIRTNIAKALAIQTDDGWTGFHFLAQYGHEFIPKLLELAAASTLNGESIRTNIAKALTMQTNTGLTGFQILARRSPESIPKLLELAAKSDGESILTNIALALTMKTNDGWTGFHALIQHSPESIPKLLELAAEPGREPILTNIAKALTMKTNDGWTGFHTLIQR